MKIGILQAGHMPEAMQALGDYPTLMADLLAGQGFELDIFPVVDDVFPNGPEVCDGWLITGSRHGAYEELPWIPPLEVLIREIVAADRPLVGICFGHQIIAQALGGKVEKFGGGWSIGLQTYRYQGAEVAQNAWHQDQVVEKPESAEVVGQSAFCDNAALLYGDRAFSVQWHPEFDRPHVQGLLETRARGVVPDPLIAEATPKLDAANDNGRIARDIGRFFRERRIA